jgi:hypothetical protein
MEGCVMSWTNTYGCGFKRVPEKRTFAGWASKKKFIIGEKLDDFPTYRVYLIPRKNPQAK